MLVTIIAWIVLGAIAGYIARFLIPGDEGLGVVGTIVLGIIGAFVAGLIGWFLTGDAPGPRSAVHRSTSKCIERAKRIQKEALRSLETAIVFDKGCLLTGPG